MSSSSFDAQKFVDGEISSNKVVVFSGSYCPYCVKAKKALDSIGMKDKYTVFELDISHKAEFDSIVSVLGKMTGAETVPRVFINGKFIGGGDDTHRLAQTGELKKMLEACGAL